MKKLFLAFLFIILSTINANATDYFVNQAGSGTTDGLSLANAWSVSDFENAANWSATEEAAQIDPGDTVYLLDTIRTSTVGSINIPGSGTAANDVIIRGDYAGHACTILGSISESTAGDWTETDPGVSGIWYPDGTYNLAVGFALFGSELQANVGTREDNQVDLNAAREYWYDAVNDRIEVYTGVTGAGGDPYSQYGDCEISMRDRGLEADGQSYLTIRNITCKYSLSTFIVFENCDNITLGGTSGASIYVGWGGGGGAGSGVGDGAMFSSDSHDCVCSYNNFEQIYDSGPVVQCYDAGAAKTNYNHTFEYNTIDRCGGGVSIGVTGGRTDHEVYNVFCRHNTVTNSGVGWSGLNNSVFGIGIGVKEYNTGGVSASVHDIYIEYNTVTGFEFAGFRMYAGEVFVRYNIFSGGGTAYTGSTAAAINLKDQGIGEDIGEVRGIVAYNIVYDCGANGLFLQHSTPPVGESLQIHNNTFYNCGDNGDYDGIQITNSSQSVRNILKNNIVYSTSSNGLCVSLQDDVICDNNLYYKASGNFLEHEGTSYSTLASYQAAASPQEQSSMSVDPLFTNVAIDDFTLRPGSPCVNAGERLGASYNDALHPVSSCTIDQDDCGAGWDLGAYGFLYDLPRRPIIKSNERLIVKPMRR